MQLTKIIENAGIGIDRILTDTYLDEAEEQLLHVVALDEALGHPDLESDRAALARVQAMRRAREDAP